MKFYSKPYFLMPIKFTYTSTQTAPPFFCSGMPASSLEATWTVIHAPTIYAHSNSNILGLPWIMTRLYSFKFIINNKPLEINPQRTTTCMYRSRIFFFFFKRDHPPLHQSWRDLVVCRLITPLKNDSPFGTYFCLYHHKSLQYKSDTMNNAWDIVIQSHGVTC